MTVGRGSKCDIRIEDGALSRVQCGVIFHERGSTCATIVDGRKIHGTVPLKIGTTVYFGTSTLRIVAR